MFIFDEPTRGTDVGPKVEVYQLMNELVANGAGIPMISSELRIYVMRAARMVAEMETARASQERILNYALGVETMVNAGYRGDWSGGT
ncbi:MAG: hypothetical protein ACPLPR_03095 [Bacillota bacterium]